jgi:peptidylprolyl isomerase
MLRIPMAALRSSLPALLRSLLAACVGCESTAPTPTPEPVASAAAAAPAAAPTPARATEPPAAAGAPKPAVPAPDDVAAPPKDAKKTKSGLATKILTKGTGKDKPKPTDKVQVHYSGWTKDGRMFDSSVARAQPATFGVDQVIKGWTEALQLMVVGEKRRLWIPAALAYGERPMPGAPAGDLTFDVELLAIVKPQPVPKAPPDVKQAPKTASKTASGLAYRLLSRGSGVKQPGPKSRVTVHYTGWTPDGKSFDSSVSRGEAASFGLDRVIKGWTEGLQLMKVGDRMRFWIPSELAYGDKPKRPGAPAGMLVFDVELIDVQD